MMSHAMSVEDSSRRIDAWSWAVGSVLVLSMIPIGFVSGDGLAQSSSYAKGTWFWNPNHLLLEPVAAWWQMTLSWLGSTRSGPDQIKLLSILSGAIALGLTRWGLAGPLAHSRAAANLGTAWVAFSSGFSRLWISDEAHMLQMPFLVLLGIAVLWYFRRPSSVSAIAIGAIAGTSALFYASNILLALSLGFVLAIWHASRREWSDATRLLRGAGFGAACVSGAGFLLAWMGVAPSQAGIVEWLTTYAGGAVAERVAAAYGAKLSVPGLMLASARAVYGSASIIVDLAPIVEVFRDNEPITNITWLNFIAFVAALWVVTLAVYHVVRRLNDGKHLAVFLLAVGWILAILSFGIYWNNSDDQFYFQLAVPIGVLIASLPLDIRRDHYTIILTVSCFVLSWNVWDLTHRYIFYPRAERIAMLDGAVGDAGLIIYPGYDEVGQILFFVDGLDANQRLSITSLAERHDPQVGLNLLESRVREVLNKRRRVDVISVFDVSRRVNPWKFLSSLGYDQAEVQARLQRFPIENESRRVGPFTVRSIKPRQQTGTREAMGGQTQNLGAH